jgi:hypothetical protein
MPSLAACERDGMAEGAPSQAARDTKAKAQTAPILRGVSAQTRVSIVDSPT